MRCKEKEILNIIRGKHQVLAWPYFSSVKKITMKCNLLKKMFTSSQTYAKCSNFFPWTIMNTYNPCFDFHMHLESYTFFSFFLFKYSPDSLSRGFCFTFTFCGDWMWSTDTFHCFCDECATILVPLKNRKEEHFSLMSVWQLCLAQFVGFGQHYQQKQTLIQRKSPLK